MKWKTLVILLAACAPGTNSQHSSLVAQSGEPARVPVQFPAGWTYPAGTAAQVSPNGMVASSSRIAAEAGAEILRAGGNAVDAAVATGFALAVVYPEAGNIGGGGYMVIRMADGRMAALDYRERAPLSSSRNMFIDSAGRLTQGSVSGRSSAGVPGVVAGLTAALAKYGSMPLELVMAPAIRLASDGFVVDSALARSIAGKVELIGQYTGATRFLPGGKPIARGSRFAQPELAATLRLIARNGAAAFYKGPVAAQIVAEMESGCPEGTPASRRASMRCGLITTRDLAEYEPVWRAPVKAVYRGHTILSMPPSSSGGITLGETLNILEKTPVNSFDSPARLHFLAAAFQRAFTDRNALLGDADFVKVPMAQLLSKSYAAKLRSSIDPDRATPTAVLAMPSREGTETTHYSVVDSAGNAVSTTTTLNSLYGSGVFVKEAGFFLNNTMDDFAAQPGTRNQFGLVQGEANAIAPRKRMLSAMTPTIVLDPRGNVYMVLGARGG